MWRPSAIAVDRLPRPAARTAHHSRRVREILPAETKNPPGMVPGGLLMVAAHRAPLPVDQSLRVDMNESKRDSAKRNHNT